MSTLRLTTISNQSGSSSVPSDTVINGSAKAWVNFNGTGTVAIRASFNVSSITDNGTGDYTVNFTTAMSDANYAPIVTTSRKSPDTESFPNTVGTSRSPAAGSIRMYLRNPYAAAAEDSDNVNVAVFR